MTGVLISRYSSTVKIMEMDILLMVEALYWRMLSSLVQAGAVMLILMKMKTGLM